MKAIVFQVDSPEQLERILNKFFDIKHSDKLDIEIINTQQTFLPAGEYHWGFHPPRLVYTMLYTEQSFAEYEAPRRKLTEEDFNAWMETEPPTKKPMKRAGKNKGSK